MAAPRKAKPRCIIIAGPNGAGKTTFARNYLLQDTGIENFVNADSIAAGLSPLRPERAAQAAGDCCSKSWSGYRPPVNPSLWKAP